MPLRNDLLEPIPGDNPSGQSLRYAPVYDKIKEARREDDDAAQGDWKRERKIADWPTVIKTASEVIATKSKDLQLAAWLTEALLKTQGVAGLKEGLDLLKGLLEKFWDTVYPEIEDGDLELRAAPLEWVGLRFERPVRESAVTRTGYSWFQWKESRRVPTEAEAEENNAKAESRETLIAEGKLTQEDFETAFNNTPKAYYVALSESYEGALESLAGLDDFCTDKFGDIAPSFSSIRSALEEVQQQVRSFLNKKREREPDEPVAGSEPEPETDSWSTTLEVETQAAAAPVKRRTGGPLAAEPVDRADAIARVVSAAKFLRTENAYDPAPYLMLRGLRWGELRAAGTSIDQSLLEAPPSELRQSLKRASVDGSWSDVLEHAETAMGMDCGRGWLDLQRYVSRACYELSYEAIRASVISGVRGLLTDYPTLPEMTMMDDTATANAETQAWIRDEVKPGESAGASSASEAPAWDTATEPPDGIGQTPDVFELALQAVRSGRPKEGIELLMREMTQERTGRGRFQRKAQLAQLCVGTAHEPIAFPILKDLAAEIERRKLEDWESPDLLAHPLALLYKCLSRVDGSQEESQKLYSWLCRLDPLAALSISR
ncbi:MAG TPA: type VI secretion system protein TssA [Candidatus Sulfopaludibacter sp.]|jgi:type VI secretion system protein ImpA|nr:type VI secretion system protein TssA [Candidatus Sulfopaludibacter sp.]